MGVTLGTSQSPDCAWNAEDYAENSSAQMEWAEELIAKLDLRGNESVLDIGCGDGKVSARLARGVPQGRVLGIDSSSDMIVLASARFPPDAYPNLNFLRMDAAAIRLSREYDLAFSAATLHWVVDHRAVLAGVRACLRPGGRLLFQMGGRGNAEAIRRTMERSTAGERWAAYFEGFTSPYRFYGPVDYEEWLPAAGFRLERVELVPKDMRHGDVDGLTGWLRTTWFPYTDRLPTELRERFLAETVAAYLEEHPLDSEGGTHVGMVRLEVEARLA